MNPAGQGELPAGVAAIEENVDEKNRAELGLDTDQQTHTQPFSEKPPATPISPNPKSPIPATSPTSPVSQSSDSDTRPDLNKYDSKIVQIRDVPEGDAALAHLPDHEKAVIKKQLDVPETKVTYWTLYRYATRWDKVFIAIAVICAIGAGAVLPLMTVVFGNLSGNFSGFAQGNLDILESFNSRLNRYVLYFVYLAIGEFFLVYISTVLFIYTGEHITSKVREQYLMAILRQNIGFFDVSAPGLRMDHEVDNLNQ